MKIYLAGAVCHDAEGNEWRESLEAALTEHECWNPIKQEDARGGHNYRLLFQSIRAGADRGDLEGLDELRSRMASQVIPTDLEGIDWCDAVVCYIKKGRRVFGSVCEIYEAKKVQGKSVYLVTELKYSEMNNWEIALSDEIFFSLESIIGFLNQKSFFS